MSELEKLLNELKKLGQNEEIEAMDLFEILKEESKKVSINTIMGMSTFLREDFKYIQNQYKEHYTESILSQLLRINEIKNDNSYYLNTIDKKKFNIAIKSIMNFLNCDNLYDGEEKFNIISILVTFYSVFLIQKPIHPVGTTFPGENLKIKEINDEYFCPVKSKQIKNPNSLCSFCICKSDI
ncbi:hypothetical protein MBCUT_08810 [Methanobrevibacter cuticularis]|uniref:UPF0305 protein MBCUT_08810 n=1 Tax=Methanobrevibacter cuticularis TaxID=47311 RepID=A0A166E6F3_9EURY|nr:DUF2115 family protein [Methanobrevibacter cuticularis]KZX16329.1 hypothetical protein MBCUT_08810 [Methanobrevibacter cuticularis]